MLCINQGFKLLAGKKYMQSKTSYLSFFPGLGCITVMMLPEKKKCNFCVSCPILSAESQKPSTFQKLVILSTQLVKSLVLNLVLKIRRLGSLMFTTRESFLENGCWNLKL